VLRDQIVQSVQGEHGYHDDVTADRRMMIRIRPRIVVNRILLGDAIVRVDEEVTEKDRIHEVFQYVFR
jgi:hypothetical protein